MGFIKNVLATILGVFISIFLMAFLSVVTLTAIVSSFESNDTSSPVIESNSILEISAEDYSDFVGDIKIKDIEILDKNEQTDYTDAIMYAASDENIKGIIIREKVPSMGIAKYKPLRDAIVTFKKSGKFVYAYGNNISQKDYYLKSVADSIFLNPLGYVDFKGLSSRILYFKDFEDKSGIEMKVIRHGKYKSAVEPFLFNKMSKENREQISSLINSIWEAIIEEISESRGISKPTLNIIADNLGARTAQMAIDNKMIDKALYPDEFESILKSKTNVSESDDLNILTLEDYIDTFKKQTRIKHTSNTDKIAVIYASGEILPNDTPKSIGYKAISESVKDILKDEDVKGVILRVDSPGGDAQISDMIWHDLERLKAKKPLYVSMGHLAASGGYYISCGANKIFAEKTTITGSIGVFGVLPIVKKIANKYGINEQHVATHKNAFFYSPFSSLPPNTEKVIQESIENIYTTFVKRVSEGRNKPFSEVNEIGQGRVWTGQQAKDIGLVDEIGGLDKTIEQLASKLDIENYNIVNYPRFEYEPEDLLKMILSETKIAKSIIGSENYNLVKPLLEIKTKEGIQASLPFKLIIE